MSGKAGRRDFFVEFLREVVSAKREVEETIRGHLEEVLREEEKPEPTPSARGAGRTPEPEELRELVRETGLGRVEESVLALVRPSLRLSRGGGEERSRLGGVPDLPAGFEWPRREGRPLRFVGQLRLEEVAAPELPDRGLLLFFWDDEGRPDGLAPGQPEPARVLLVPEGEPVAPAPDLAGTAPLAAYPLHVSRELTVPREYSAPLAALELTPDEDSAWIELARQLLELHGLDEPDAWDAREPVHRVLGWPDELYGEIEREAALVAAGLAVDDGTAWLDERADEIAASSDWRLLLQLSHDTELATTWGSEWNPGRLFFLIRQPDLEAARFDRVHAIYQGG